MRVAFLGPEGTFTEEALLATARDPIEPTSVPTVHDSIVAVQAGTADRALVPIENSLEGSVNATLDALAFDAPDVCIVREITHPIRHHLIAAQQLDFNAIDTLVSHPHAKAQCGKFLRHHLGHVLLLAADSTAEAVRMVSTSDKPWAALGTELSASLYDCRILRSGVEDSTDNRTRFVYLARDSAPDSSTTGSLWKTSVVCGIGTDRPGALLDILKEFADRSVNLCKIESRPARTGLGAYLFFIDAEGSRNDGAVAEALAALEQQLDRFRVLGSYPCE